MGNRFHCLPRNSNIPDTPAHILTITRVGFHRHGPNKPSLRIVYQHVPYAPRSTRERLFSRLGESEVSFLDVMLSELDLELAGLETASCEKERAGRVLVRVVDWYCNSG